ncbi:MAG: hypothetical protein ACKO3A_09035, partial [Opitutia bacterium]
RPMSTPSPDQQPSEEPKALTWGFRVVLLSSALYIAGCSAYFSVLGLGQLFTGSEGAVMVMAASLEVGKLVAASFLYRYWHLITGVLRFYLTLAVLVLIAITSLGNYGYLARAYEKTATTIARNETEIAALEKTIADSQRQIDDARGKTVRVNTASREDIAKLQGRITQAGETLAQSLARLQEQRKALDARRAQDTAAPAQRAAELGATLAKSIAAEEAAVAKAIAAEETAITGLNDRLKVLDQAVAAYTAQGTTSSYLIFEQDNVKKGQELREQQKPERDAILAKLTEASAAVARLRADGAARVERLRADQARVNADAAKESAQVRDQFKGELARLDAEEKALRKSGEESLAGLEKQLAALQEQGQTKAGLTEAEVEALYKVNRERTEQIHKLRDQIAATDIGSYRFVARAFDAEATDVVKWLMLALVAVFDPLAVTLVVAFNMALSRGRAGAAALVGGPGSAPAEPVRAATPVAPAPRRSQWSRVEIIIASVLAGILLLLFAWLWMSDRQERAARGNFGTANVIPGDSFAVLTFRPDELRQKGSKAFPEWLERTGGKGLSAAVGELLKNGLDPRSDLYAFAKFPADAKDAGDGSRPVMLCGLVIRVVDPTIAEAALSRIADQLNNSLRGEAAKTASNLTRSRSMIKHGEGRYMDPEGGFFTFGLTNRTAIILVEFEGDPAAPCVEKEIRLCLTRPEARPRKPGEIPEILPHYASDQPGALTLWLDANRFFRRLPMGTATRARYEQMRPAMEFELLLALAAAGDDSLSIAASYLYQFDRFADGATRDPVKLMSKLPAPRAPDLGWKLMDRCVDTLDYDSLIERMRGALGDDKRPGAQLVRVEKTVPTGRDAKFTISARFDPKAGPPLVSAMQLLAQ